MSVLVVGSFVVDLVAQCERAPEAGETLTGKSFNIYLGGKGANQAIAAKRMGANVVMAGCLGTDIFGDDFIKTFKQEGLSVENITRTEEDRTGCSLVTLETNGQNRICMTPGANLHYTIDDLKKIEPLIKEADVVVTQCEMQPAIVDELAKLCKKYKKKYILNPAPARQFSDETLSTLYAITPNETELGIIVGRELKKEEDYVNASKYLIAKGVQNVVVTLGSKGSLLVNETQIERVPVMKVTAVDTVGAGDSFTGSLAAFVDEGKSVLDGMRLSTIVGGLQVQRRGAIPAMPYRKEVEEIAKTSGLL